MVAAIVGDTVGYWIGAEGRAEDLHPGEVAVLLAEAPPPHPGVLRTPRRQDHHHRPLRADHPHLRARRRGRRQDELPPVRQLQRVRRHRLVAQHDADRIHARPDLSPDHQADRQGHHRHHRGLAHADGHQLPRQPKEEGCRPGSPPRPPTMAKPKPDEKPRAAPKVAFPKKAQPPTHAEFAARLPAPVGKRFEVLRTYLKKQGAAEDFYYYGPRSGWAYRYLKSKQSVCSILLLGRTAGRHRRPRQRRADEHRLGRSVRRRPARAQARPRNPGAALARRPARRHRRDRLQVAAEGQARARRLS